MTNTLDVRNYLKHKLYGSRVVITIQVVQVALIACLTPIIVDIEVQAPWSLRQLAIGA